MALTFFSLNIEADRHLDIIDEYLQKYSPDVVHLQEVYKVHAEQWSRKYGYHLVFGVHANHQVTEHIFKPLGEWGVATLTREKTTDINVSYYSPPPVKIPTDYYTVREGHPRTLVIVKFIHNEKEYTFGNTHFTWAMPDKADIAQAPDFARFQEIILRYPSIVFSGDFNAPRETMVYRTLSNNFISWIPESVDSTLDPTYFRKPELKLVVDHLFSTPDYQVKNVQVLTGLSDHCGISAVITK